MPLPEGSTPVLAAGDYLAAARKKNHALFLDVWRKNADGTYAIEYGSELGELILVNVCAGAKEGEFLVLLGEPAAGTKTLSLTVRRVKPPDDAP